jgi:hypothetical protein
MRGEFFSRLLAFEWYLSLECRLPSLLLLSPQTTNWQDLQPFYSLFCPSISQQPDGFTEKAQEFDELHRQNETLKRTVATWIQLTF